MKKNWIKLSFVLIFVAAIFLPTAFARAQATTGCSSFTNLFNINSANLTSGRTVNTTNPTTQVHVFCSAGEIFTFVLNLLFEFTGAVAVIFIILGGFWFMTSAGNEERAEKGRKTLINSIIGLVVIILAATIVRIVVNTLTGGSSGSGTNTSTNSSGSSSGNTNTSVGNNTSGSSNPVNDALITISPPNNGSTDYVFSATLPATDANALTTLCGSTNYTFRVALTKNTLYGSTVNFTPTGTGFAATYSVAASSLNPLPDTATYYICNQEVSGTATVPAPLGGN